MNITRLLDDATRFPVDAADGFGHVRGDPDLVTPKLPASSRPACRA